MLENDLFYPVKNATSIILPTIIIKFEIILQTILTTFNIYFKIPLIFNQHFQLHINN